MSHPREPEAVTVASVRVVSEPERCHELWNAHIPREQVSDLWEVRWCFQKQFGHELHFLVYEDEGGVRGLLPLSRDRDSGAFTYFPGETWHGKTWLEQNRIVAHDGRVLRHLLRSIPGPYQLRYLRLFADGIIPEPAVDEVGYLFLPPKYDYRLEAYFGEFSHKSAKRLRRELASFEEHRVEYRVNELSDFDRMIAMNVERYGSDSYFYDGRFRRAFRSLLTLLAERGWLRLTTVLIGGEAAAVDMGCDFRSTYTLLGGGTSAAFPGVAKLINLHHIHWACERRAERVDFLCGDFNWKTAFHLTPRPLHLIEGRGGVASSVRTVKRPRRRLVAATERPEGAPRV